MLPTEVSSYTWKIPSLTKFEKNLLYYGYIKENYDKYIPHSLVLLLSNFYSKHEFSLKDLKNSEPTQPFFTSIVSINSFKYYLEIYPNGCNIHNKGDIIVFVCLATLPPKIGVLVTQCKIELIETNTSFNKTFRFNSTSSTYFSWNRDLIKLNDITHLNQISFRLTVHICSIMDHESMIITKSIYNQHNTIPKELPVSKYQWKITDPLIIQNIKNAKNGEAFCSGAFNLNSLKWEIQVYPNGNDNENIGKISLYLNLLFLPPKMKSIAVKFKLGILETNIIQSATVSFQKEQLSWGWYKMLDAKLIKDKKHLKTFTISLIMVVLDIYDIKDDTMDRDRNMYNKIPKQLSYSTYKWIINDLNVVNQVKNAENGTAFHSKTFDIDKFKFYLEFYPNGDGVSKLGNIGLFIHLISTPPNINIAVKYKLYISELNCFKSSVDCFNDEHRTWGWNNFIETEKLKDLNNITILVKMLILNIFDNNNNDIDYHIDNYPPILKPIKICNDNFNNCCEYKWEIKDKLLNKIKSAKENGDYFLSPLFEMYSLKWYLKFNPIGNTDNNELNNDDDDDIDCKLQLCVASMTPNLSNITIHLELSVIEINKTVSFSAQFTNKRDDMHVGWMKGTLKNDIIQQLNKLTFNLKTYLIDVYDINGNDIIKNLLNNKLHIKQININSFATNAVYTWKIRDNSTVCEIHELVNHTLTGRVVTFVSPIFAACGTKFYISFCPNGSRESRRGFINVFLYLASFMSPSIAFIIKLDLIFIETNNFTHSCYSTYTKILNCCGWTQWPLKTENINILNKYSFKCNIKLIDVYDNDKIITKKYIKKYINPNNLISEIKLPSETFLWNISSDTFNKIKKYENGRGFNSKIFEMFSISWFLTIYPNGKTKNDIKSVTIYINILSFPHSIKTEIISIRYTIYITETSTRAITTAAFTKNQKSVSWGIERILNKKFIKLNKFTVNLKIELVDIYCNYKNITKQFISSDHLVNKINYDIDQLINIINNDAIYIINHQ